MTILEKIFATKHDEVALARQVISVEELRARAAAFEPRGFRAALMGASKPALIAEVKKGSPSMGEIRAEFDPVAIAQSYERAGATCLSVLTDVQYFQGSPTYLREVRAAVSLPLLRKDFVFDTYQLDEARAWGADCVLLIVAGLEQGRLTDLYHEAKHRLLDVLVEVHDEAETEFAVALGADMIGINNRDLRTFKTDLSTTSRLIQLIPEGVLRVSESALESADDVRAVHEMGADAVLIGTAFCASPDIEGKVREVMGR